MLYPRARPGRRPSTLSQIPTSMKKTLLLGAALLSGASLLGAQTLQDPKPQEAPPVRGDETGQSQDKKDKKAEMISVWVLETTGKG